MRRLVRIQGLVEYARGSLWVLPSLSVLAAIVLGVLLSGAEVGTDGWLGRVLFPGGPEGGRGMLQAVAGSVITVTSLVFSLTVVTLQLASSQFSPRLLRTFLRRPGNQVVLSIFLATFVYSLVVLRTIQTADERQDEFVPSLAISVAFLLVLASVAALVFFIHHITNEIRADTLMLRVTDDTLAAVDRLHPDPIDLDEVQPQLVVPPDHALVLPAAGSGIVQALAREALLDAACRHDAFVRLAVRVGDRVVEDGVLAWVWKPTAADAPDMPALTRAVNAAVTIGHERTMQQDVSYGLRQLVDIAAKALSTGVNDPTTAVDATGHLSSVVCVLARRRVVDIVLSDGDGVPRLFAPERDFADYLHLATAQIRRYGSDEPAVVVAVLHLLREAAEAALLPAQAAAVAEELELVVEAARGQIEQEADLGAVLEAEATVRTALSGSSFARLDAS